MTREQAVEIWKDMYIIDYVIENIDDDYLIAIAKEYEEDEEDD